MLKGQCLRSDAGLYYDNYYEFKEALTLLESDETLRRGLGINGKRYYRDHYHWAVIEEKYNRILRALRAQDDAREAKAPKAGFFTRWLG